MEQQQIFVQMALNAWNTQVQKADKFFESLNDEGLLKEVAPGKNRIIYLLGHLIAVNDNIISLFGAGERLYAHFDEAFVKMPDRSGLDIPQPADLRKEWKRSNEVLSSYFERMTASDWFSRHTAMTDEDLIKEPTRNKLSVLINRTNHVAYHLGQLVLAN
ncbi:MAG: DinB family protein [Chitinophagaceae bacterium]|nr:DinB family protein [Chitinophagaceae bacterium]